MTRWTIALSLMLALAFPASANDLFIGPDGQPLPDTASRQSKRGFSGALVITADPDWRAKWDQPSDRTPQFEPATQVRRGGQLSMLVFFANPRLDADRKADVRCDIQVTRPDGSVSAEQDNVVCYQGPALGNELHVYLAAPVIYFLAEPEDLAGRWTVKVTLRDDARRVMLPLEASFELVD
ncbi:hypothetical protein [Arenimonas sp. MALMAid1274]|uniref:hypothetical protein n=1 Tax=Arenimonas sp. MALMAid1274 TaxID=3411630 RepID=UPI003B9E22C3